jgi:hypothetical protein
MSRGAAGGMPGDDNLTRRWIVKDTSFGGSGTAMFVPKRAYPTIQGA